LGCPIMLLSTQHRKTSRRQKKNPDISSKWYKIWSRNMINEISLTRINPQCCISIIQAGHSKWRARRLSMFLLQQLTPSEWLLLSPSTPVRRCSHPCSFSKVQWMDELQITNMEHI
jgi:hypothetical protein